MSSTGGESANLPPSTTVSGAGNSNVGGGGGQTTATTGGAGQLQQARHVISTISNTSRVVTLSSSPITVASVRSPAIGGGGGFVLRGNQLVRLPPASTTSGAAAGESTGAVKSPLKVHLVSASGLVKPGAFGISTAQLEQGGEVRPKYQVVVPSGQGQSVVMVSSSGNQNRLGGPQRPVGRDGQNVFYSGGTIGASATVGETIPIAPFQSLNLSGSSFKKSRSVGIPGARKPCNCTKSQCLKLYCECFANGEFCRNCNCTNCHNNLAYENERSKSIKMCLERNPYAFQPKIGTAASRAIGYNIASGRIVAGKARVDADRLHNKGCNCKKSNCLKNYCECYEAKVPCTPRCKCVGCRNTEGDRHHKYRPSGGLQSLANAASLLATTIQPGDFTPQIETPLTDDSDDKPDPKKMPWYYMTDDVVEATALCLLAKAEQMEASGIFDDVECQNEILKEFGRCLEQIIECAAE